MGEIYLPSEEQYEVCFGIVFSSFGWTVYSRVAVWSGYSGHQQMPVKYYVPYAMSGHQHMYVPQPQAVNFPGYQQMPVKYYVPSAMSGHQHMYVPQPQSVNLDLDYSPSIAFPGTMHTVHNDGATKSGFDSRSGSVNADEFDSIDTNNTEVVNLGLQEEGIPTDRWWCQGDSEIK